MGSVKPARPLPADPIGAAIGSLADPGPKTDMMRAELRAEEALAEDRRTPRAPARSRGKDVIGPPDSEGRVSQ